MENLDRRMLLAGVGLVGAAAALAQSATAGQLNPPPGPVAATGATPVQSLTGDGTSDYVISQPGSYVLSGNLAATKNYAIMVNAEGVTIDLRGFEISRASGSPGVGIEILTTSHRTSVRNGSITGFGIAVENAYTANASARSCAFRDLAVGNCSNGGIFAGDGSVLESCRGHNIAVNFAIFAGTGCTLSNCVASYNTGQNAIVAGSGSSLINCSASNNALSGAAISAGAGATLVNCAAVNNSGPAGIFANAGSTLFNCTVQGHVGTYGIDAGPSGCTLSNCSTHGSTVQYAIIVGIDSTVNGCSASFNTNVASTSAGIYCTGVCTVTNCFASSNTTSNASPGPSTGIGFLLGGGSTIQGCATYANSGDGIQVSDDCIVLNNECVGNGTGATGSGVHATSSSNRIEGNNLTGNHQNGLRVDSSGNLIVRNCAKGNGSNYSITSSNRYGPVVDITSAGAAAVSGNSAASVLLTTDPWANFAY